MSGTKVAQSQLVGKTFQKNDGRAAQPATS